MQVGAFFSSFPFYNLTIPDKPVTAWAVRTSQWTVVTSPAYKSTVKVSSSFPLPFFGVPYRSVEISALGALLMVYS